MKTLNKKSEQKFREFITKSDMKHHWRMTWHEDHDVSPGVPDLHFVMKGGPHQVGWIELKSTDLPLKADNKIEIQPSQHQYIREWVLAMPIWFLVNVCGRCHLIKGHFHSHLAEVYDEAALMEMADIIFPKQEIALHLPDYLKGKTAI